MAMVRRLSSTLVIALLATACASLDGLRSFVQPPRFEQSPGRDAEIRVSGSGGTAGVTSATVRLWTRVTNPNRFGFTLGTLRGTLRLEGSRAAGVDFPLGLPLQPGESAEIPIDIAIDFRDLPALARTVSRALAREPIAYELEGTIGVSAGALGEPVFGPMTLLRGEIR
jgi:Late embryogenesis abundant protein